MAKDFRLHNNGEVMNGWSDSQQYNSANIADIADPGGASAKHEITSIPSPFARMDLVREAFAFVNRSFKVDKGIKATIHHKMVSHALDVAQIFFNYDNLSSAGLVRLIKWNRQQQIANLTGAPDVRHQLLGKTLELFFTADAQQFHFDRMTDLFILEYIGPNATAGTCVIGATSPCSLFFTTSNDHSFLAGNIRFEGRRDALSNDVHDFVPLYQRDRNFIVWFYALRAAMPTFGTDFDDVNIYLDNCFQHLPLDIQQQIRNLNAASFNNDYALLSVDGAGAVPVDILGTQLRMGLPVDYGKVSGFALRSAKPLKKVPLVLPCTTFARHWKYTTAEWNSQTQVPIKPRYHDGAPIPMDKRTLPDDGANYPYLVMTDFLEDTIVRCSKITDDFFDGNLVDNTSGNNGFLLPVKPLFFKYFTVNDLKSNIKLTVNTAPGGGITVKVVLKIPVRGNGTPSDNVLPLERLYMEANILDERNGSIVYHDFTAVVFPRTKFGVGTTPNYRVALMSNDQAWKPSFDCLDVNGDIVRPTLGPIDRNSDGNGNPIDPLDVTAPMSAYSNDIEVIVIRQGDISCVAVPSWATGTQAKQVFHFAVDFGTTNTHIEYYVGNNCKPKALDIEPGNRQLALLNTEASTDADYDAAIKWSCVPTSLGVQGSPHFPLRTLLTYKATTNWSTPFASYLMGNIPFYYGSLAEKRYNKTESDLKWSTNTDISHMVECYLSSLMILMRNKVVMEQGDVSATHITWFYPTSMPTNTITMIDRIWQDLFSRHINSDTNVITANLKSMPESIAPYAHYKAKIGTAVDVLTIDIGGGTSDAFIFDSNANPALITSFRFAANSVLGDGFTAGDIGNNGFVRKYAPIFDEILSANGLNSIAKVLKDTERSTDFLSLLFSLKENPDVINKKVSGNLDFIKMLSNDTGAKTIVLVFYSAIMFYMALFYEAKRKSGCTNVQEPQTIAFSGNGSKLLQVLGASSAAGLSAISTYTKEMFELVSGHPYSHEDLKIVIDAHQPKEATCKGGLLTTTPPTPVEVQQMNDALLGTSADDFLKKDGRSREFSDLTDKEWNGLEVLVKRFTDAFYTLAKKLNVSATFGTVNSNDLEQMRCLFTRSVSSNTRNALAFINKLNTHEPIEDTLFFYHITSLITELARKLIK